MDAPGSGHSGSVLWDNATGRSHWNPSATKVEVRDWMVWVMILPMQALRSNSLAESWSNGLGNSVNAMQGWVFVWVFKILHLEVNGNLMCTVDYKFFIKKVVIIPKNNTV